MGFICGGFLPPMGSAGERPDFDIKPPLRAALLIFPRRDHLKFFPQGDSSARQRGFQIRVIPLLGELPKTIEPHLPACQSYRWQLASNTWSSPTTKSLDPIIDTALRVDLQGESLGPATVGFACNFLVPEVRKSEAAGHMYIYIYEINDRNKNITPRLYAIIKNV